MLEKISNLIDPLAQVLDIDIDIVDSKGIRISATGIFKKRIGKKSAEQVYSQVVQKKQVIVIEKPGSNVECKSCININQCSKKIIIAIPVILKNEVVAVIGFFSFNNRKREDILSKIENYIDTFKNLEENISQIFFRNDYFEIYHEFFINMEKAALIIDERGIILDYNKSAHLIFSSIKELVGKQLVVTPLDNEKYQIKISNVSVIVLGYLAVEKNEKNYITFTESKESKISTLEDGILIGKSRVIVELKRKMEDVIKKNMPLLVKGEVGTDKEMFARWIHNFSNRSSGRYLSINCREEEENKIEAKLFGVDVDDNLQVGILESANGGTVFINEIDYMDITLQKKLLHFLKTSNLKPANSEREIFSDVRIIASSKENLMEKVKKGLFIENLYYKLDAADIEIPSLKYRKDDLEEIIEYLISKHEKLQNKAGITIEERAKRSLIDYEWKGNWKELEGVIKLIVEFTKENEIITYKSIPEKIKVQSSDYDKKHKKIRKIIEIERDEIIAALSQYGLETEGKQIAAKKLGIGIATLYRKIENYQIDKKMIEKIRNL